MNLIGHNGLDTWTRKQRKSSRPGSNYLRKEFNGEPFRVGPKLQVPNLDDYVNDIKLEKARNEETKKVMKQERNGGKDGNT
jgi:hypothetical protein